MKLVAQYILFILVFQIQSLAIAIEVLEIKPIQPLYTTSETMKIHADNFVSSLSSSQLSKLSFPSDSPVRSEWRYLPEGSRLGSLVFPARKGLQLNQLNADQKRLLWKLVNSGLAQSGQDLVSATMEAEKDQSVELRGRLNKILFKYGPDQYFISLFGSPAESNWGWRFEGHHISLNVSVQDQVVKISPLFLGANPAHVKIQDGREIHPLQDSQILLAQLIGSLSSEQVSSAAKSLKKVPQFNLFAPGLFDKTLKVQKPEGGLPFQDLTNKQKEVLKGLLETYQSQLNLESAALNFETALSALDSSQIVWFGAQDLKGPFYFRLQNSKVILEFMSSENDFDHYHTSWILL